MATTTDKTIQQVRISADALAKLTKEATDKGFDTPEYLGKLLTKIANGDLVGSAEAGSESFFTDLFYFLSNNYQFKAARDLHTVLKCFKEKKACPHDNQ